MFLLGGSFSGGAALIFGAGRGATVAKLGREKSRLLAVMSAVFALIFTRAVAAKFIDPTPAIVIDHEAIVCSRRIRWVDIAHMDLVQRRVEKDARFTIRSGAVAAAGRGNQAFCEISRLTEDYRRVYSDIHIHWMLRNPGAAISDPTR
jgi:hypothetical protein